MNFKSRPEGRLNCRARIGSSAWLRGSSQNSKMIQTTDDSTATSIELIYYNEQYGLVFTTRDNTIRYVKNDSINKV